MVNIILILLLIGAALYAIYYVHKKYDADVSKDTNELVNARITVNYLIECVAKTFAHTLQEDLDSLNLSQEEYEERERTNEEILANKKEAAHGNPEAKRTIKKHIRNIIQHTSVGVTKDNINQVIAFDDVKRLTGKDKFQILLFYYTKKHGDIKKGFDAMMYENHLVDAVCINPEAKKRKKYRYLIDDARISAVYDNVSKNGDFELSFNDQLDIVTQRVFEMYIGLNSADLLLEAGIDEVDGGVSQIPEKGFTKKLLTGMKFSHEVIWIVYHGLNIQLTCLPMGSQKELERVVNNIYKFNPPYPLNESDGYVACSMWDDTRVVVMMPPFSEDYAFFARKHDSAPGVEPEVLVKDNNAEILLTVLYWLVKGYKNFIFSGQQGTGKTTFMKAMIYFIPETVNIRVNEMIFELGLRYAFPHRNTLAVQQTATISMQDGLNILKKTNGFANLIGEIAEASQSVFYVQQSQKASAMAWGTHHGKTTKDVVNSMAQDLQEEKVYQSKEESMPVVVEAVNFDCHLAITKGHRHVQYLNEVIPIKGRQYPYPNPTTDEEMRQNNMEYYIRQTDREYFDVRPIIEFKNGSYELINLPSQKTLDDIERNLIYNEDIQEFHEDMEMLKNYLKNKDIAG